MVVHAYYPLGEPRVEREARAARDAGYTTEVISLRRDGEPAEESVDGIQVRRVALRHVRGAGLPRLAYEYVAFLVLAAIELVKRKLERGATVQVHAPPDFLIFAALPARLRGARVLLDIHDLSPHMFGARFGSGLLGRFAAFVLQRIESLACGLASHVVTVHEPYAQELVAAGVPKRKVSVVMNSADEAVVDDVVAQRSELVERGEGEFTIAYHGTLTWWYGVDLLVEALNILNRRRSVQAMILGEGDALPSLRARAEELELADRIEFSGSYLPHREALRRVCSADCGLIPNRPSELNRFALSSKLFEYVALGIPVVVSQLETLAAHFGPDEVTFFEPGDAGSLADALIYVITSPQEARAKCERARARAERYSWQRNRDHYLRLLDMETHPLEAARST